MEKTIETSSPYVGGNLRKSLERVLGDPKLSIDVGRKLIEKTLLGAVSFEDLQDIKRIMTDELIGDRGQKNKDTDLWSGIQVEWEKLDLFIRSVQYGMKRASSILLKEVEDKK